MCKVEWLAGELKLFIEDWFSEQYIQEKQAEISRAIASGELQFDDCTFNVDKEGTISLTVSMLASKSTLNFGDIDGGVDYMKPIRDKITAAMGSK